MIRRAAILSLLIAAPAWAQQSMDISEKDVASGAAQARLAAMAREAAASGKRIVVTAPQHLHRQIAAGLAAGGQADVVVRDGFYENVLVRAEDKLEEPATPEPKAEPKSAPRPAPKPAPRPAPAPGVASPPPAPVPAAPAVERTPAPSAPAIERAPPPAAVPATPSASVPEEPLDLAVPPAPAPAAPKPAPVTTPATAADVEPEPPAATDTAAVPGMFVASEPGDLSPARATLEKLYNDGKRIRETITPNRLVNGDVIYLGRGSAVVVRRERPLLLRFWLEGTLDLGQSALEAEGRNKVRVIGSTVR